MVENITYPEGIRKVMQNNGGFAPLKLIYEKIWNYKDKSLITGLTPDKTIQKEVQKNPKFTKIGLGVYALTDFLDKLEVEKLKFEKKETSEVREHAQIQGMLLEVGNERGLDTYTNDKKWVYENKTLGGLATLDKVPIFTYPNIIKDSVSFVDVAWFNSRGFPTRIYEVEDSTDFRDAFIKFKELEFFTTEFYCVAEDKENRRTKFEKEIEKSAFETIKSRTKFCTYDEVKYTHANTIAGKKNAF
jgi:hypothetical protein